MLTVVATVQGMLRNVQQIQGCSGGTFAAILGDGSVVTWGCAVRGSDTSAGPGDSCALQSQLTNVQQIQSSSCAFAAILGDGSVVTWGDVGSGGDSRAGPATGCSIDPCLWQVVDLPSGVSA